jgi:hypothetical protein
MTRTVAMQAGSASVERLLAAAAATMEKARYCWAMTVAEDGSVNARPRTDPTDGRVRWAPAKSLWIGFMTVAAVALGPVCFHGTPFCCSSRPAR